ncbi:MAG: glycosyltransferase [Elusimicrobia bacterium]|nr:glycosyltransferase [Elusimicrobiota bacterium]
MRGGEKCLEVFCELFPEATLFSLVHVKGSLSPTIEKMKIITSFLQHFPDIENKYRNYLPLMPIAIGQFDLNGYDLIISSSHCVAKGVKVPERSLHISYCYTPMRYIWDLYDQYFGNSKLYVKIAMKILRPVLQWWDVNSSKRVDNFVAISQYIQERIKRHYNRDSIVIYPPVNTEFYTLSDKLEKKDYYLVVSAFAPYKRIDLAIETFNKIGLPLKIIGSGQEEKKLKKMANKNIEFLDWKNDDELKYYYQNCKALIFPGEEDFGIVPVEAQSCGTPVIAYSRGGAIETIVDGKTGVFFENQTVESLTRAIHKLGKIQFDSKEIHVHAQDFSRSVFKEKISKFIEKNLKN